MSSLLADLIRVAHNVPEARKHLVPIIREAKMSRASTPRIPSGIAPLIPRGTLSYEYVEQVVAFLRAAYKGAKAFETDIPEPFSLMDDTPRTLNRFLTLAYREAQKNAPLVVSRLRMNQQAFQDWASEGTDEVRSYIKQAENLLRSLVV